MPQKGFEDLRDQVDLALRSRVTLIVLVTPEEERALQLVREVCERWNPPRQCVSWDIVDGYSTVVGTGFSAPG